MIAINSRIIYSIIFFCLLMILILLIKPKVMFTKKNKFKNFGIKKDETIYSIGVFTIITSILTFYIFCWIDMIFS